MESDTPQKQVVMWNKNAYLQQMSAIALPPQSPTKALNVQWGREVKRISWLPHPEGVMKVVEVDRALILAPSSSSASVVQWRPQEVGNPTYEEVRIFTQGVLAPVDEKVRILFSNLHECASQVATLSTVSQQNVQNVCSQMESFWENLRSFAESTHTNFQNTSHDLEAVRKSFSELISIHLPQQLQSLSQTVGQLQENVNAQYTQMAIQMRQIIANFTECTNTCASLQARLDSQGEGASYDLLENLVGLQDQVVSSKRELAVIQRRLDLVQTGQPSKAMVEDHENRLSALE